MKIDLKKEEKKLTIKLDGKLDTNKGEMKYGYAKYLRESLPNAT